MASGSKQSGSSSSQVDIPDFLEPFIRQSTGAAGRALGGLEGLLGLTGEALPTQPVLLSDVRGPNGAVFVDAQNRNFVDAGGNVIAPFQPGRVEGLINGNNNPVEVLGDSVVGIGTGGQNELFTMPYSPNAPGGAGSQGIDGLVSPFTPAQQAAQQLGIDRVLSGDLFGPAQDAVSGIAGAGFDRSALESMESLGADPEAVNSLRGLLGSGLSDTGTNTLESTARGDYLFGGDGFQAAVDASLRQATPGILSTFGSAGAGGATGGLAQEALGTAAIDAFARQFAQERGNQLGAANSLNQFGLADQGQRANTAGALGALGLAGGSQRLNQANSLADANRASAQQQLLAAQLTPGIATSDVDLLSRIGNVQQEFGQSQLDAPRNALLQLLTASLGGTPIASLLGENRQSRQQGFQLGMSGDELMRAIAASGGGA